MYSIILQIYQVLGTVVYLAVSGDATCRGLRSPRDGTLTMELTKGDYHTFVSECKQTALNLIHRFLMICLGYNSITSQFIVIRFI